ncbi:hypothetical protein SDC9_152397 [bioreactor metagenome]|uniref:Uncharacterized protein n=1 Tax=bioreactor metagenome TaxID=1076179 RepID=A0A645ETH6_9ZZZZ
MVVMAVRQHHLADPARLRAQMFEIDRQGVAGAGIEEHGVPGDFHQQ